MRAARENLALVRALADQLEAAQKKAFAAERDARRERERRESAEARFDALSRRYVAGAKEAVVARGVHAGATRPIRSPTRARDPSSAARERRVRAGKTKTRAPPPPRSAAAARRGDDVDDIDEVFREARELIFAGNGTGRGATDAPSPTARRFGSELFVPVLDANERGREDDVASTSVPPGPGKTTSSFGADDDEMLAERCSPRAARRAMIPGWRFTGVSRDARFRKKCPMHEGPCSECETTCRVPFRPTRASGGREDPLCAKCLLERKARRKAATEKDGHGAKRAEERPR